MKESSLPFFDGSNIRKLGMSIHLLRFLSEKQTDSDGKIWYGRPLSYRQIQNWTGGEVPISVRTFRRWMWRLREAGYVKTKIDPGRTGLSITILDQKKFAAPGPLAPKKASEMLNVDAVQEAANEKPDQRDPNVLRTMRMAEQALRRIRQT